MLPLNIEIKLEGILVLCWHTNDKIATDLLICKCEFSCNKDIQTGFKYHLIVVGQTEFHSNYCISRTSMHCDTFKNVLVLQTVKILIL